MANDSSGGWIVLVLAGLAIYNCSGDDETEADEQYIVDELGVSEDEAADLLESYGSLEDAVDDYRDAYGGAEPEYAYRDPFDEDAARDAAEEELASEGYDYSYGCTIDCSGHDAGWQWRAENGYSTPGNSSSFDEGGRAFDDALEERVNEMRDEYESGSEAY
ncbi:MAG: hypothetical protein ACO1OD_09190 [Croceibacterium sp.]